MYFDILSPLIISQQTETERYVTNNICINVISFIKNTNHRQKQRQQKDRLITGNADQSSLWKGKLSCLSSQESQRLVLVTKEYFWRLDLVILL